MLSPSSLATFDGWTRSLLSRQMIVIFPSGTPSIPVAGIVNQITAEDGSGHCFLVTIHTGVTVFVRLA